MSLRMAIVEVVIGKDTKIEKESWYMLTDEQLAKSGGKWNPDDLMKEKGPGVKEELAKSRSINIKTTKNIFNKTKFTASSLTYLYMIYPD